MSLAKRCEIFKRKVEQNLMVADTQIGQLKDYKLTLDAEIIELKDKLYRLKNHIDQEKEFKNGEKQKRQITKQSKLAQMNSEYQAQVLNMQKQQALLVEAMQKDFEASLDKVQKNGQNESLKLEKTYNQQITLLENQLDKTHDSIDQTKSSSDIERYAEEESNAIMQERIEQLQQQVKEKQEERAKNLQISRDKLQSCVNKIEEDGKAHQDKIDDLKQQLQKLEENFNDKVKQLKDEYQRTIPKLKKKVKDKQVKYNKIKKEVHNFKETHGEELNKLLQETYKMQSDLSYYQRMSVYQTQTLTMKNDVDIQQNIEMNEMYGELQRELKAKEDQLLKEQNLNNDLKRNISRLQFEKKYAKKKALLFK